MRKKSARVKPYVRLRYVLREKRERVSCVSPRLEAHEGSTSPGRLRGYGNPEKKQNKHKTKADTENDDAVSACPMREHGVRASRSSSC